eukprot:CAMPEP_0206548700 /NCGR_PEP_ID=MMETSP0325_2-20121206/14029_1 /ASSEMBLY_ACC=CAM_ASM_000347 /TAXON_ID=2866 /ORGANISM="Crypthecodinium cohnii, Strain Seligo" /LENGTH=115 /DNA_ID=CAMNT_0054048209 /DNA_START=262 /DNA_END=611 /DNA_ORIENTATION=-
MSDILSRLASGLFLNIVLGSSSLFPEEVCLKLDTAQDAPVPEDAAETENTQRQRETRIGDDQAPSGSVQLSACDENWDAAENSPTATSSRTKRAIARACSKARYVAEFLSANFRM